MHVLHERPLFPLIRTSLSHHTPPWRGFSKRLKRLIKDALRLALGRDELAAEIYTRRCRLIHQRLAKLIADPYQDRHCQRLVKRLKRHQNELLTFLEHPEVPADNNHAERMIRPAVIARKNSYCNRSPKGAETQAIMMSIFRTLHLQKMDPIVILNETFRLYCQKGSLPPLPDFIEVKLPMAA